jgi:hypothetical protein
MCDNPNRDPWEVLINPAFVETILYAVLSKTLEKGIDTMQLEIPELKKIPREDLEILIKGIERKKAAREDGSEGKLAHVEFDIQKIKKLSEKELTELLGRKLVPRIIEDIKKLEVNRPIPDWCYAFF